MLRPQFSITHNIYWLWTILGGNSHVCPQLKSGDSRDSARRRQLVLPQEMLYPSTLSGSTVPHQTSAPDIGIISYRAGCYNKNNQTELLKASLFHGGNNPARGPEKDPRIHTQQTGPPGTKDTSTFSSAPLLTHCLCRVPVTSPLLYLHWRPP